MPPIVFLHGIGGGAAGFEPHVRRLSESGRRAIAWNQPGYGGSELVDPYTFEAVARSLVDALDREGIGRCIPVGHSMGAMIALELYAAAPQRVAAMVLANGSPAFGSPQGEFQRGFVAERTRPLDEGATMAEVAARVVPGLVGPDADPRTVERAARLMAEVPEDTYRRALAALVSFDRRSLLPSIAVPVLCLAAAADRTAPPAVLEKMASKIPGARYRCLEGLGHLAPIEDPERFCEAVESFVGSVE